MRRCRSLGCSAFSTIIRISGGTRMTRLLRLGVDSRGISSTGLRVSPAAAAQSMVDFFLFDEHDLLSFPYFQGLVILSCHACSHAPGYYLEGPESTSALVLKLRTILRRRGAGFRNLLQYWCTNGCYRIVWLSPTSCYHAELSSRGGAPVAVKSFVCMPLSTVKCFSRECG